MNIELHIERLVLEGLPLARTEGPELQAAVERELVRLLGEGGLGRGFATGGAVRSVRGGALNLAEGMNAVSLGEGIAGAVYTGLGGEK